MDNRLSSDSHFTELVGKKVLCSCILRYDIQKYASLAFTHVQSPFVSLIHPNVTIQSISNSSRSRLWCQMAGPELLVKVEHNWMLAGLVHRFE